MTLLTCILGLIVIRGSDVHEQEGSATFHAQTVVSRCRVSHLIHSLTHHCMVNQVLASSDMLVFPGSDCGWYNNTEHNRKDLQDGMCSLLQWVEGKVKANIKRKSILPIAIIVTIKIAFHKYNHEVRSTVAYLIWLMCHHSKYRF